MKILLWHVHGSWTTSFVQGRHDYVVPVTPDRGPDGLGRAHTWHWPPNVVEVRPEALAEAGVDVVILQRPHERDLVRRWLRAVPGVDVPGVYLEHNTPEGDVPNTPHPMADQSAIPIVHVTRFNDLYWDRGKARTHVIEHGVIDPGQRWTGELRRAAVAINDPIRRWRTTGTDLLPHFAAVAPLDVFGMNVSQLRQRLDLDERSLQVHEDLPQWRTHAEMARRRVYLHTPRWTSLGLSLIEAMLLAMPVVVLATTEAASAVPPRAGVVSTSLADLADGLSGFLADPERAREAGLAARDEALRRYNLQRFLDHWDDVLQEVAT